MKDFLFLSDVKLGDIVSVTDIKIFDYKTKTRLYELGICNGTKICVLKKSLFSKTYLIKIGVCEFVIRKDVASKIVVNR